MDNGINNFFEIVFNDVSARDISDLGTLEQLNLLNDFKVTEKDLDQDDKDKFGKIKREGKTLYRYRTGDLRIYFEIEDSKVVVNRVLHKNSFKDFLFRSNIDISEDEELGKSTKFWELIEEGSIKK